VKRYGPERPAFVVGRDTGRTREVQIGLVWLFETDGGDRTVIAPVKGNFVSGHLAEALGDAGPVLGRGGTAADGQGRRIRGVTQRTFHRTPWRGGPVLVLWPDAKALASVDADFRVSAICVVPWSYDEVATWAAGRQAVDLLARENKPERPTIRNPVVAEAMSSLTTRVNLSTGLGHPSDRAAAVNAFRVLKRAHYRWTPDEIEAWALGNGWSADGAAELRGVAAGVLSGRRYQVERAGWSDNIVELWKERAETVPSPTDKD
jgi:hypothetical protein